MVISRGGVGGEVNGERKTNVTRGRGEREKERETKSERERKRDKERQREGEIKRTRDKESEKLFNMLASVDSVDAQCCAWCASPAV